MENRPQSSKHICTSICLFGEHLHSYLHATSAVGVCCVAMFINTKKTLQFIYKQIQGSKRNSEITGFSPVPVKLLCCSSVQDEDSSILVSTYERSVSIPSRARGGWQVGELE